MGPVLVAQQRREPPDGDDQRRTLVVGEQHRDVRRAERVELADAGKREVGIHTETIARSAGRREVEVFVVAVAGVFAANQRRHAHRQVGAGLLRHHGGEGLAAIVIGHAIAGQAALRTIGTLDVEDERLEEVVRQQRDGQGNQIGPDLVSVLPVFDALFLSKASIRSI